MQRFKRWIILRTPTTQHGAAFRACSRTKPPRCVTQSVALPDLTVDNTGKTTHHRVTFTITEIQTNRSLRLYIQARIRSGPHLATLQDFLPLTSICDSLIRLPLLVLIDHRFLRWTSLHQTPGMKCGFTFKLFAGENNSFSNLYKHSFSL